jgi:hypothetical protein
VQNEKNKNEKRIFCHIFFDFVRRGGGRGGGSWGENHQILRNKLIFFPYIPLSF